MTDDTLLGLARNPALPADLLAYLLKGADDDLSDALAHRADLTTSQALALFERRGTNVVWPLLGNGLHSGIRSDDPWVGLAVLDHPGADPGWIPRIARGEDAIARSELATRFPLPPDIARLLAEDDELDVVLSVARCQPSLEPDLAADLARHPHAAVRAALAGNESASPDLLRSLFDGTPEACYACRGEPDRQTHRWCDGEHDGAILDIRLALTYNPSAPPDVLNAVPRDGMFAWALAERTDLPNDVYAELTRDRMPGVRHALANNPAAAGLIPLLLVDSSQEMKREIALNPEVPLDLLAELAPQTRIGTIAPRILSATEAELRTLAESPVAQVRRIVAARPDLPADLIDRFADDTDAGVARWIAVHPRLSPDQLRGLAARFGHPLYARIAQNPHCPADLVNTIAADPETPLKARRLIAAHPGLAVESIVDLLADPGGRVTEAAAANPSLPVTEMMRLLPTMEAERGDNE